MAAAPASSTLNGCDSLTLVRTFTWMRGKYCVTSTWPVKRTVSDKSELRGHRLALLVIVRLLVGRPHHQGDEIGKLRHATP